MNKPTTISECFGLPEGSFIAHLKRMDALMIAPEELGFLGIQPHHYVIQIKEAGRWHRCTDLADNEQDALTIAASFTASHHEDAVRIVCPDGTIL